MVKNNSSKLFNRATNVISGIKLHDHNCGYKAYKLDVVKNLNLYGELHRYIAVLAGAEGYVVGELPINHRVRFSGKSKYGPLRFIHGFLDLLTVFFITKFRTQTASFVWVFGLGLLFVGIFLWGLSTGGEAISEAADRQPTLAAFFGDVDDHGSTNRGNRFGG